MARDVSGNYTLPAGNPIAFGEKPASSSKYNAVQADIAIELTDSLSRSGKGAMLADLDMGGFDIDDPGDIAGYALLGMAVLATPGGTAAVEVKNKCYATTGDIEVPASVFAAGDAFGIYNNSASAVDITQGAGATLRFGGTTLTGARILAPRGLVVVWFHSATEAVVVGSGLS